MTTRTRLGVSIISALILSACAAQPYRVVHVAPTSDAGAIYTCALGLATSLGYTAAQANKDSGFFKVERSQRKGPSSIHWGETVNEELTVLVLTVPNQPPTLQVTAAANSSFGRNARLLEPTAEGKADAEKLIQTCAK